MRKIATLVAGAALAGALAGQVRSYPEDGGPFEGGRTPRVFRIHPCAVVEHAEAAEDDGIPTATLTRSDGRKRSARIRLGPSAKETGLCMTVIGPDGETLAGPQEISGPPDAMFAFWADLNGDTKEDFVALVWSGRSGSNLGFALSSERGYGITSITSASPGSADFVDLGDGKCRLIQTALVRPREPEERGRKARELRVYNLLEFDGDSVKVSKADERFPKWVSPARGSGKAEAAALTPEEKSRLWAAVPERVFWHPPEAEKPALASAGD